MDSAEKKSTPTVPRKKWSVGGSGKSATLWLSRVFKFEVIRSSFFGQAPMFNGHPGYKLLRTFPMKSTLRPTSLSAGIYMLEKIKKSSGLEAQPHCMQPDFLV